MGALPNRPFLSRVGNLNTSDHADQQVIKKYFPCAELAMVPGVGHWVHAQAPDIFEKIVHDFFSCPEES